MPLIKDLPLEDKLGLHVLKLPFSKEVKNELYSKGVRNLGQIVDKFLYSNFKYQGRYWLPGFKDKVFAEACCLLSAMELDSAYFSGDDFMQKAKVRWHVDNKRNERINAYVNKNV